MALPRKDCFGKVVAMQRRSSTRSLATNKPSGILKLDVGDFAKKYDLEPVEHINSYFAPFEAGVRIEKLPTSDGQVVEVVRLPRPIPHIPSEVVGKSSLYLRPFYSELADKVLERMKKVVLIGNPGVSKSHFQFTVLCALLADEKEIACSSTLTTIAARLKDINVVVRQLGEDKWHVLFLREKLQYTGDLNVGRLGLFDELDLSKTLYLFDTGPEEKKDSYPKTVNCQSLCTLSPLEQRYKGYVKQNRAIEYFMPLYREDEMVAIGLDMAKQADFPADLAGMYTEDEISKRYQILGGVLRTVLPSSAAEYDSALKRRTIAVDSLRNRAPLEALNSISSVSEMQDKALSNSIALMDVPLTDDGKYRFKEYIVSPLAELREKLRDYVKQLTLGEKMDMLISAEKTGAFNNAISCRMAYQDIIYELLTSEAKSKAEANISLSWSAREAAWGFGDGEALATKEKGPGAVNVNASVEGDHLASKPTWRPLNLPAFRRYARWNDMTWDTLQPLLLVFPSDENYPFIDLFYKDIDDTLVVIQVWFGLASYTKDISAAALRTFLEKKLRIPAGQTIKIKLLLFPPHSKASTCRFLTEEMRKIASAVRSSDGDSDPKTRAIIEKLKLDLRLLQATVPVYEVVLPPEDYGKGQLESLLKPKKRPVREGVVPQEQPAVPKPQTKSVKPKPAKKPSIGDTV
eukprot:gene34062-41230_t